MKQLRVVLADDNPSMRERLRRLIESANGITVVGEAIDGYQALNHAKTLEPDVLVLDMDMPHMSGLEVTKQLQTEKPSIQVLIVSIHDDIQYIHGLLKTGAAGYLIKSELTPDTLIEAIQDLARGEKNWVTSRISAHLNGRSFQGESLSRQEREILKLVVVGKTDYEISLSLGLSEEAVRTHVKHILTKLDVVSRVKAAVRAVKEGLV